MKKVLITGSSGYIGQHLVKLLHKDYDVYGIDMVALDNDLIPDENFMLADIRYDLNDIVIDFRDWPRFDTVIHLAAFVRVNESVEKPYWYYNNNVDGTRTVLTELDYDNFIFASTGAAENPISPYALSKRMAEDIVKQYCGTSNYTIFRFYNVIGTDGTIAPTNPDGLFSNLIKAEMTNTFNLFGHDYNTTDGSAVRDYVHVMEICYAIRTAIEDSANGLENLGHGKGHTVLEMIAKYQEVNNCMFNVIACPRREGDLEYSVLDNVSSYMEELYTFDEMMKR